MTADRFTHVDPEDRILTNEERTDLGLPSSFSYRHDCSDAERLEAAASCRPITVREARMIRQVAAHMLREKAREIECSCGRR